MKTRRNVVSACVVLSLSALFLFSAFVPTAALAAGTGAEKEVTCKYCGMMKSKFGHTWMVIEYDDGSKVELCSIHCGALDMALNLDKTPKVILVGDYNTQKPIDAEKAFWVIGGSKTGVMTARAKWAFDTKAAADKFMGEFGGAPATFDDAIKAAFEDMYQDTIMIRKKRQAMMKKSG